MNAARQAAAGGSLEPYSSGGYTNDDDSFAFAGRPFFRPLDGPDRSLMQRLGDMFGLSARLASVAAIGLMVSWAAGGSLFSSQGASSAVQAAATALAPAAVVAGVVEPASAVTTQQEAAEPSVAAVPAAADAAPASPATATEAKPVAEEPLSPVDAEQAASAQASVTVDSAMIANIPDPLHADSPRWGDGTEAAVAAPSSSSAVPVVAMAILPDVDAGAPDAVPATAALERLAEPSANPQKGTVKVAAAKLQGASRVSADVKLRASPDNEAKVIGIVPAKATVNVQQCKAWCKITWKGQQGYVFKKFVVRS